MNCKKLISAVLSAAMVLGTAVFSVQAAEGTTSNITPAVRSYCTVTDNEDGTYTVKSTDANNEHGFNLPTKNYTLGEAVTTEKYVKISAYMQIKSHGTNVELNQLYRITENNSLTKKETRRDYQKNITEDNVRYDMIVDLSSGTSYMYLDSTLVHTSTQLKDNNAEVFCGGFIMTSGKGVEYVLSNVSQTVYSSEYTLADVQLSVLPKKTEKSLIPLNRGNGTMTDNSDGTYTYETTTDGSQSSFKFVASKAYSISTAALTEKFVRISADIKTVTAASSSNELALLADTSDTRIRNANTTKLTGNQNLDVIVDLSNGTAYIYFDGTKKSTNTELKTYGTFGGFIIYANYAPAKYILSNVTETVYSAAMTLSDIELDMIDDIISEESTAENNGVPSGLTNWNISQEYDAKTDTVTVTDTSSDRGRFSPLATTIKLGDESSYAGLYHFTTFWTTTKQDEGSYFSVNIGSASNYNVPSISPNLGNKYTEHKTTNGREYRVDVIIDTNDASAPMSYVYRDGVMIASAALSGTDLMNQDVYASIRIFDAVDYEGKFRGTKAIVYKKGVKSADDIKAQIVDEISKSDMPVTIAAPEISYDNGKLIVKTEFVGAHTDKTKYVAGLDSDGRMVFVAEPEAAAAGITLDKTAVSTVKVFAWDELVPVAYSYEKIVVFE